MFTHENAATAVFNKVSSSDLVPARKVVRDAEGVANRFDEGALRAQRGPLRCIWRLPLPFLNIKLRVLLKGESF